MILFSHRIARASSLPIAALALLAACGGDPIPAETPPTPTQAPTVAPTPPPTASASAAPSAAPIAAPAPSGSADAAPAPKQTSGRPAVLMAAAAEITDTFGSSPGAKVVIGEGAEAGTFKIPENALRTGTVITLKIDKKAKSSGAPIGHIFHITAFIPPANAPSNIVTEGPPFELIFPAGSKKNANLALGTIEVDDKGKETIKWEIIAPKRIDDAAGLAYFELNGFSDTLIHVTAKPVTAPKK